MKKKILFYGDIGIDIIAETTQSPQTGHDASVENIYTLPGGSSANSAVVASNLMLDSYYMGLVGNDIFHELLINDLKENNVKLDLVREVQGNNNFVIAIINETGERTFYSYRGVSRKEEFGEIAEGITKGFDCVHISGYCMQDDNSRETALSLIKDARENSTLLTLDPSFLFSSGNYGNNSNFISNFDIVIPNQDEAKSMTRQNNVAKAARLIRQMGPKIVVVKMAKDGCLLSYDNKEEYINAYPISHIKNAIGAGDAFCSGFLSGYLNGLSLEDSARIGNAAAHIVIRGKGGHSNTPTYENVIDLIKKYDKINLSIV